MRLEKRYRTQAVSTSMEHIPNGAHAHAVSISVLDDVELVPEPSNEAINRALNGGDTALIVVVCGGESVVLGHRKTDPLETLISQMRLLLG